MTELEAAVERVWPGRGARFEILGGGITNHNLKVHVDGEVFVLRVAGKDTDLLGIDRGLELAATKAAAALGIGPEVVHFVEPEGWLVTRFVEGETPPPERMRDPRMLARVAEALRSFHQGPRIPGRFDAFRVVDSYRETALARGGTIPADYEWAHELAAQIERHRAGIAPRPCHNDLLNANFLDDGERLRIVDWEYAGMGDPFFDLANFSINHELGPEQREVFLRAYSGEQHVEGDRALELMRFMSDFREAMWGVVQTAVSTLDFDFAAYAAEHFERLRRTAAEPSFRAALGS
jgi:thiamine kinase-like enzyme